MLPAHDACVILGPYGTWAPSKVPMLAHASVRGSRMTLVDAYIIEGLRLPIAWSMMKTDPYP
tara:strand:+ start:49 stop:234 length:186 start_codon:yes stop_codon:yes gene_type:complete